MTARVDASGGGVFWRMWAAAFFWGVNWPVVKIMLATNTPWSLRAAGLTGGALCLLVCARVTGTTLSVPRTSWGPLVIAGILNVTLFNIFAIFGQLSMPTSRAAILTFTMPLWGTLFAWIFLGEVVDRRRLSALVIGFLGLGVLAVPFWPTIASGQIPFGLVYVLGAAISWAAGTVYLKGHRIPVPPLTTTVWQVVISAVLCGLCMLAFETPHLDLSGRPQLLAFIYHAALPQCLAYILWFDLMSRVKASTAVLGTLLVPIFGVLGAIVLLGDWPSGLDVAGLVLILGAVTLDQMRRAEHD